MRSDSQHTTVVLPDGRVDVPGLLYGSVGLALGIALQWMGAFKRADGWIYEWLNKPLFRDSAPELPTIQLTTLIAAVFCYGLAFAVLDSVGMWRKVVLGVTAMVLTLAMVPAFAVWNVYFSPVLQITGVFWSWFCVVLYAQHHRMPCDSVHVSSVSKSDSESSRESLNDSEAVHSDEKYQPKQ